MAAGAGLEQQRSKSETPVSAVSARARALLNDGERLAESFGRAYAAFIKELASSGSAPIDDPHDPDARFANSSVAAGTFAPRSALGITDQQVEAAQEAIDQAYRQAFGDRAATSEPMEFDESFIGRALQNRIRATMKQQKLTQKQVAGQMGMDPAQFSRLLKRPQASSVITLARIATHLGLPASRLLEGLEAAAASPSPSSAA